MFAVLERQINFLLHSLKVLAVVAAKTFTEGTIQLKMSIFAGFGENVTYMTPCMAQMNSQRSVRIVNGLLYSIK